MTDRELLELAAKAAGIDVNETHQKDDGTYVFYAPRKPNWNPLTDDGDALRLAVKLGLNINHWERQIYANRRGGYATEEKYDGTDPYLATRRAIVRAASEIGKGM